MLRNALLSLIPTLHGRSYGFHARVKSHSFEILKFPTIGRMVRLKAGTGRLDPHYNMLVLAFFTLLIAEIEIVCCSAVLFVL